MISALLPLLVTLAGIAVVALLFFRERRAVTEYVVLGAGVLAVLTLTILTVGGQPQLPRTVPLSVREPDVVALQAATTSAPVEPPLPPEPSASPVLPPTRVTATQQPPTATAPQLPPTATPARPTNPPEPTALIADTSEPATATIASATETQTPAASVAPTTVVPTATRAAPTATPARATATLLPASPTLEPPTPTRAPATATPAARSTTQPTLAPTPSALPTSDAETIALDLRQRVARAEQALRSGEFQAMVELSSDTRSSATVRFILGNGTQPARLHSINTYRSPAGTQTTETIMIGDQQWQRLDTAVWTMSTSNQDVWAAVQAYLPLASSPATAVALAEGADTRLTWHDPARNIDVTLVVDAATGIPREMRRLVRPTGLETPGHLCRLERGRYHNAAGCKLIREVAMRILSMLIMTVLFLLASSTPARAQGAELRVLEPMQGAVIRGNAITVIFEAEGRSIVPSSVALNEAGKRPDANRPDEGHLHLMLDLQPVVVWERTESYTFQNVLPGQHQLMIEIVNNDHSSLTPPVVTQLKVEVLALGVAPSTSSGADIVRLPNTAPASSVVSLGARGLLVYTAAWLVISGFLLRRRWSRSPKR